jgi:hypothetical protein
MIRLVRADTVFLFILSAVAGIAASHIRASSGVIYLIGLAVVAANVGLLLRREGINVRHTVHNPFASRRRKP